jgi:hypothetical protein
MANGRQMAYNLFMKNVAKNKNILKIACIMGTLLLLIFFGLSAGMAILSKTGAHKIKESGQLSDFYQKLRLFDDTLALSVEKINHSHIKNLLRTLDESAAGAEARLLVLKRYRNLARRYPEYREDYRKAAVIASEKFPHAAVIAALAVEADMDTSKHETREKLKQTAALLSENGPLSEAALLPVAFCLYALSGVLDDINSASSVKRVDSLYAAFIESQRSANDARSNGIRESMLVDAALLSIMKGDQENVNAILARLEPRKTLRAKTLDFMANYAYDFSNPLVAAELWSSLGTETGLANAASALYIAGETEKARDLWLLLIKDANDKTDAASFPRKILYNLALTAENTSEKSAYLERMLANTDNNEKNHDIIIAGLILYTRLQSEERARAILSDYPLGKQEPLLDLEYLNRVLETMPLDRSIAETWLALNRHPNTPELYRWAAWYFEYQRRYEELSALRRFAAQYKIESPYLDFHKALGFIRDGKMNESIDLLESIEAVPAWQRYANLALILDARHEYSAALRYYEDAAAEIPYDAQSSAASNDQLRAEAARIFLLTARCRRILGAKPELVRRDLERAYDIDRENIDIRIALRNLER